MLQTWWPQHVGSLPALGSDKSLTLLSFGGQQKGTDAENALCERLVGSIRRECLDFLIPLNERHLRGILKEWVALLAARIQFEHRSVT